MENLPPESLIEIFGYLDKSVDLERASAVCTRWRDVIRNSPEIMNSIWRNIHADFDDKAPIFFLPYKNLDIWGSSFTIYLPLSNKFSFLKQLSILDTDIKIKGLKKSTQLALPHLEYLELDFYSEKFLRIIYCTNVRHFIYTFDEDTNGSFRKRTLRPFFVSNSNLKRLCFHKGFPNINFSTYEFKLEHLEIDDAYGLPSHFINFLKAQQSSLKELFFKVYFVEEAVLNYIYFEMNLTKLLDNHRECIGLVKKFNQSIKSLSIKYGLSASRDASTIEQLVYRCQALEFLRIELNPSRPKKTLQWLTGLMPRLKTVALSFKRMKDLKLISKWIKANGFHASLSFIAWQSVAENIVKEGYEDIKEIFIFEAMILFISAAPGSSLLNQFGKVVNINAFLQISINNHDDWVKIKNLTLHKQDKRIKKSLQIRMSIEHMIISRSLIIDYLEFSKDIDD